MNRTTALRYLALGGACLTSTALFAVIYRYSQTEATTARFDAQRTGWIRLDHFIAPDKMSGFKLQWKTKLENTPRNGAAFSGGIVTSGGLGITLAYFGSADNRTFAVDMDNGHPFFNRSYGAAPAASGPCLSASVATPTRNTPLTPPMPAPPTPAGQSATGPNAQLPYGSILSEPGEGIPPVKPGAYFAQQGSFFAPPGAKPYEGTPESAQASTEFVAAAGPARGRGPGAPAAPGAAGPAAGAGPGGPVNADGGLAPNAPPAGAGRASAPGAPGGAPVAANIAGAGFGGGGRGFQGPASFTYALSNDGKLHGLSTTNGLDRIQPMPFVPAGAQASDLIMVNNAVYAATMNGCGGAPNGIWSVTPAAIPAGGTFPKVGSWTSGGSASPHTPAFNADGLMFVTVGSGTGQVSEAVVSLDPGTLTVKGTFKQAGANFVTTPVILRVDNRDIVAAQTADGRIFLLDGSNLSSPLFVSPGVNNIGAYIPAGLAAWQDGTGQRWILSTTPTSVLAYKLSLNGNSASLMQAWTVSGLKAPLAPLVVNGVVFVLSTGEYVGSGKTMATAAQRATRSTAATLFAVDGTTGQTIWNSGQAITSFVPHSSAVWNSMGQILVGAYDGTLYAFGMNMERHL